MKNIFLLNLPKDSGTYRAGNIIKSILLLSVISCQCLRAQQIKFFETFGHGIYDSGEGVLQANDTGYVVGGITTQSGSNGTDVLIYKTDSLGALQWYKNIGLNNCIEGARTITGGISGSGYLLAGYQNKYDTSGYNFYVVKTDLNGDTLWTRAYGGSDWDMAYSADTLNDSTYVIAGETYSFGNGNMDMYVIRIDQNGDTLWSRTFGGTEDDYARYVYVDRNNNIMLIGTTNSFGAGGSDVYAVYLNTAGDTIWTRTYGTATDEYGYSGDMYTDIGYYAFALAYTWYNPVLSAQDTRLMRTDTINGATVTDWQVFLSNSYIYDHPRIRQIQNGIFAHCGDIKNIATAQTEIYMHQTGYGMYFGFEGFVYGADFDWPRDIRRCFDHGYIVTGETRTYGPGPSATFLIRTDSLFVTQPIATVAIEDIIQLKFSIYPNPVFEHLVYIDAGFPIEMIKLIDLNGRIIQTFTGQGSTLQTLEINLIPSGMYILEVVTSKGTGRKKILVG